MSSEQTYMTFQNSPNSGQAYALSSEIESLVATQILSTNVLSILGLVLIIINVALIA